MGTEASLIAKDKSIRKLVHFCKLIVHIIPQKYSGSCFGRDITYKIVQDADFKFFVTANIKIRARRRFQELKNLKKSHILGSSKKY